MKDSNLYLKKYIKQSLKAHVKFVSLTGYIFLILEEITQTNLAVSDTEISTAIIEPFCTQMLLRLIIFLEQQENFSGWGIFPMELQRYCFLNVCIILLNGITYSLPYLHFCKIRVAMYHYQCMLASHGAYNKIICFVDVKKFNKV